MITLITCFQNALKQRIQIIFYIFLSLEIDFKTKEIILMAESNECLLLPLKVILGIMQPLLCHKIK
jgi:hypothetical protein